MTAATATSGQRGRDQQRARPPAGSRRRALRRGARGRAARWRRLRPRCPPTAQALFSQPTPAVAEVEQLDRDEHDEHVGRALDERRAGRHAHDQPQVRFTSDRAEARGQLLERPLRLVRVRAVGGNRVAPDARERPGREREQPAVTKNAVSMLVAATSTPPSSAPTRKPMFSTEVEHRVRGGDLPRRPGERREQRRLGGLVRRGQGREQGGQHEDHGERSIHRDRGRDAGQQERPPDRAGEQHLPARAAVHDHPGEGRGEPGGDHARERGDSRPRSPRPGRRRRRRAR